MLEIDSWFCAGLCNTTSHCSSLRGEFLVGGDCVRDDVSEQNESDVQDTIGDAMDRGGVNDWGDTVE